MQHLGCYLEGQGHSMTLQQNHVQPITLLLEVRFYTISHKWSPYWDDVSRTTFGSLPWRFRSQHDLWAKLCPAHNFVIWSQILKIFHRDDHHIEVICRAQHLVATLKSRSQHDLKAKSCQAHNFVIWSRILQLFHEHDHNIETCHVQHMGYYLEG